MSIEKFWGSVQSFWQRACKNQNFTEKTEKTCINIDNQDFFSIIGGHEDAKYR